MSAEELRQRLDGLLTDACRAKMRGYDWMVRIYMGDWERLWNDYMTAITWATANKRLVLDAHLGRDW